MIVGATQLLADFMEAASYASLLIGRNEIEHRASPAPHVPYSLPKGRCAVYVFSLSEKHGAMCPAGPNKVLKVGMAGPKSNMRFQYQHYSPGTAKSTLAGSLLTHQTTWLYLGVSIDELTPIKPWMLAHLDRDDFLVPAEDYPELGHLERYVRARLGPAFEGG